MNRNLNRSTFYRCVSVLLLMVTAMSVFGQQLPDPGFEDWSGAQFASQIQPKYWNFSNVSQLGVDRNFAHQVNGRSGKALLIQDQFVGAVGIGATSPGYVALGHPWAFVSSLTSINDATAGTYGGIAWTHRPDSMVVWIRRYYDSSVEKAAGDHMSEEHFHLLYYAWSGTSRGSSYKAKDLSCTNISSAAPTYCVDEESDIRRATNGNECGTDVQAKQIAEGWYHEAKAYPNWTCIKVPIYYMNDDAPQKCNVILSAGRYPDFRANNGQYAGSSMEVDDISLIYSSKIQKLYINNREWKAFDPDNTDVQTYSLGQGATAIPEISAIRGAGSLTNSKNVTTTFPGRRLSATECVVTKGTVDGTPTLITVTSEDGLSTTTYRIQFVSAAGNNARLSDIRVNGQTISGFNAYLTSYNVALPYGTTQAPEVSATAQDGSATVTITQATSPTGQATIHVTSADGTTQQTYTLSFSVAELSDVTLQAIYVDGSLLPGYVPTKANYTVSLPLGTTSAPAITWESAYPEGAQTVQLLKNSLGEGAQIKVSLANNSALSKTYKLTYKIEASSYSYLSGIALDGVALEDFQPEKTAYTITLPLGTSVLPAITWTQGDSYQTVTMTEGGVDGVTRVEVVAANGSTTVYRLTFRTEKSENNALLGIALDGVALDGFDADSLSYSVILPAGSKTLPKVTYTAGDAYQQVTMSINTVQMTVRLTVTAGNGSTRVYTLFFEVEKSANALLQMIYLNDEPLDGFVPEQSEYSRVWHDSAMPHVTVSANEGQMIAITTPATYGTIRIVVTPEEGSANTYLVHLNSPEAAVLPPFPVDSFPVSDNAQLAALYIGNQLYEPFDASTYHYTYPLERGTVQVPSIMPVGAATGQTITVAYGAVNRPTTIRVQAADSVTTQTYVIDFTVPLSANKHLQSVEIEGVSLAFDSLVYTYTDLVLPYGVITSPAITAERSEPWQSLIITEAPIGTPSTIEVIAEDGTKATYSFSYRITPPEKANVLTGIVVDGVGALDMSTGPDFTVQLPYGSKKLDVVSVSKNYPEQAVVIQNEGIWAPTTITVKSLDPSEADAVYTITPVLEAYDKAMLLDLQVNGATVDYFARDRYDYVVSVSEQPNVTFTPAVSGLEIDTVITTKWVKITTVYGDYMHTYTVNFYYPGDLTFETGFENFAENTLHLNKVIGSGSRNVTGKYPLGWNAPITATTLSDKGTYYPQENTDQITSTFTQGSSCLELETFYLTTSSESMPGFVCLSQPTISIGQWVFKLWDVSSTIEYGSPIVFRNTPDQVKLDYNVQAFNRVSGWRFIYKGNKNDLLSYSEDFSSETMNQWRTMSQTISYPDQFVPDSLDILISAAPSDVLGTYKVAADGSDETKRYTSKMYVDNLRLLYSSEFKGVRVNGVAATPSGTKFSVTVDGDAYGIPELVLDRAVSDQMSVVTWSDEVNRIRTATIRNYAEDLSYTDYTVRVTRPKSKNTSCTLNVEGRDLTVIKGSPYQTVTITTNDTAYVVRVKAENGSQKTYYVAFGGAANVTVLPAEQRVTGSSTAQLVDVEDQPVLTYAREYALDSVSMEVTDTAYAVHVFGSEQDTVYLFNRHPSSNALLASMQTNGVNVPGFYEQTYDYTIALSSLDDFQAVAQDSCADVQYTIVPIDSANAAVFVQVTAQDGITQKRYSVLVHIHDLATDAYLSAILVDDVPLSGFSANQYDYTIPLPAGSAIPQVSSVSCPGATVETFTAPHGSSATVTFTVVSEDGLTTRTYTVDIQVAPSAECRLSNLFTDGNEVADFNAAQLTYAIELPYGTTSVPMVDYVLTDKHSTASVATNDKTVTVTVTAEDGIHQTVYTITFSIAKSNNANLQSIALDGESLANFYADEYNYSIQLPYGAAQPLITAVAEDSTATVTVIGSSIVVKAEDEVTVRVYTVTFTYAPSSNATLAAIASDSVLLPGFDAQVFDYTDTVPYGSPMPVITWTTADEQQKVDTAWVGDTQLTITVTAGDGVTGSEYTLTFLHQLSVNWHLSDLQVNGVTIDAFHRDSLNYTIVYPIGTDSAELIGVSAITAVPEEQEATVSMAEDQGMLQIFVTSPGGEVGVYTISQEITLSGEARLKMVWLDSAEVRAFHMDTMTYTIVLAPGSILPTITAEPVDSSAVWEVGMEEETESGKRVQVYCFAPNGSSATYVLNFTYANWTASSTVDADDYLFFYIGNGRYKAVTIGIDIQFAVYDMMGHQLLLETLPVADPSDVYVVVDANGNQRLVTADPEASGVTFTPHRDYPYFYVFFDSKTKRIAKGGKFVLQK